MFVWLASNLRPEWRYQRLGNQLFTAQEIVSEAGAGGLRGRFWGWSESGTSSDAFGVEAERAVTLESNAGNVGLERVCLKALAHQQWFKE